MKTIISGFFALCCTGAAIGQTFSEVISKELDFEKKTSQNTVLVSNINGNVQVVGYEGNTVIVEVTKKINAKTQQRLEAGKTEIQLGIIDRADTLIFYTIGTCNKFGKIDKRKRNFNTRQGWGYHWEGSEECNLPYDYTLNFKIKVPHSINLMISTVNDGDVTVENTTGALHVENINGAIKLKNISQATYATTINGDVDIDYAENPVTPCRFYTLNGNINARFQQGLAATMAFKSFNGDFFTNVKALESLPAELKKERSEHETKYVVNGNRFKIGNGGPLLDFETFNGNVYLNEKPSSN